MNAAADDVGATVLQRALFLAEEHGLSVFPCRPNKKPYTDHGFKDASSNIEQIARWWTQWPDALVGVATGRVSDLFVVDVDPPGAEWYRQNAERLACGLVHKTKRGHHLVYSMPRRADKYSPEKLRISAGKLATGIDVRCTGGYVIWWPAHGYDVVGSLDEAQPPPEWVLEELLKPSPESKSAQADSEQPQAGKSGDKLHDAQDEAKFNDGRRNDCLSREAFRLRKQGLSVEQIDAVLQAMNKVWCEPQLPQDEVRKIAQGKASVEPDPVSERPMITLRAGALHESVDAAE